MNDLAKTIRNEAEAERDLTVALRRELHRFPELAREEFKTQQRIEKELDALGLEHWHTAGTGVMARIDGAGKDGAGRKIVLRADIDALPVTELHECEYKSEIPGHMHACGHDGHTAALIAAARLLCRHREDFSGSILLAFQPGEEVGYGARVMAAEGQFNGCTRSFGLHMASELPVGKVVVMPGANNASVDWFRIRITGLGAHVSVPQRGVDAAYIAAQILIAAQSLITRMSSPIDNLLIGIGKVTAGTAYNVVADLAEMEGTIRSLDPDLRIATRSRLEKLSKDIAAFYGGSAEVDWADYTSVLVNDETACLGVQDTARALFGPENVITSRKASLGGDDMAEIINLVPGCYAYIGSCDPAVPETGLAHHHACFDIGEDALTVAASLYAAYALAYMRGEAE